MFLHVQGPFHSDPVMQGHVELENVTEAKVHAIKTVSKEADSEESVFTGEVAGEQGEETHVDNI